MQHGFKSHHHTDADAHPTGGVSFGTGFTISWQNGPLGRDAGRIEPNGAFVEDIIAAARDRIAFYQSTKFKCEDNAYAILNLDSALANLRKRTADREEREVEGTHAV